MGHAMLEGRNEPMFVSKAHELMGEYNHLVKEHSLALTLSDGMELGTKHRRLQYLINNLFDKIVELTVWKD